MLPPSRSDRSAATVLASDVRGVAVSSGNVVGKLHDANDLNERRGSESV